MRSQIKINVYIKTDRMTSYKEMSATNENMKTPWKYSKRNGNSEGNINGRYGLKIKSMQYYLFKVDNYLYSR